MRKLRWLLLLPVIVSAAAADIQIFNPSDKLITFDEIIMLRGKTAPRDEVYINGIRFSPKTDGSFSCGLILKNGKNLVEVRGAGEKKEMRVLRLLTYPDIEISYEGKKHWARGQAVYLSTLGMVEGYPDGNFYPGNPVTRGELATWLAKAKKLPVQDLTEDVFFDVPKEHWRAPFVKAVTEVNYLPSYSKEIFGIDDPISRRDAAEVAVRAEGLGIVTRITPLFKEEKGAAPIYTARESGLVIGVSKDIPVFDPERALTRAEAATLISRFGVAQAGVRSLSNFEQGYSSERSCGVNTAPVILSFTVEPAGILVRKLSSLRLRAAVASREVFSPLSKVKVDLSSIGGMPDAEMFDDGTNGDALAGDGTYSLNFSFEPKKSGEYLLRVTATDRLGWEGKKETTLLILE
jgi:hypothetical protein